jgi:uncharacterized protein
MLAYSGANNAEVPMFGRARLIAIPLLAIALFTGGPAAGQSVSPEATAAARELLTTMRMADQLKAILPLLMKQLGPVIAQGRPEVERDLESLMPLMLELVNKRSAELVDATAVVYVRHFTVDEMRQLTAFYREPIGQKLLEKLPAITQESMGVGQKFGQVVAAELQARIVEELRKRGHKI